MAHAQQQLESIVGAMPRATIVHRESGYVAAQFRSLIFRFIDDVEFSFDSANAVIHFRSASRSGHSDFGVNRKRMQQIAAAFAAAQSRH